MSTWFATRVSFACSFLVSVLLIVFSLQAYRNGLSGTAAETDDIKLS